MAYTNSVISFGDDDAVTDVYTYQAFPLGLYREEDGKGYRFVKFDNGQGNVAAIAGNLAFRFTSTDADTDDYWTVTMDLTDASRNEVAGVFAAVIADGGYGWLQVKGPCVVNTDGGDDIAAGDAIIAANADGTVDSVAAGTAPTHQTVGFALAADTDGSNTVPVRLQLE